MTDLDNLIWHRLFLARVKGINYTVNDLYEHFKGMGYSLEQVTQSYEGQK